MDFHPVILAAGRGSRMYPLTEYCPKALLPVGNMPLIWYPIQLLERNGFEGLPKYLVTVFFYMFYCAPEALVVVRDSERHVISEALERLQGRSVVHLSFILCDIPDQEDWGTADSLRHIRSKVKVRICICYQFCNCDMSAPQGDVIVISCDLVTCFSLHTLMLFHHAHHSTVTALFHHPPQHPQDTIRRKAVGSTLERDVIGLTDQSRIVLFSSQADLEENLELSRSMLQQ